MDDNAIHNLVKDETRQAVNPLWEANKEMRLELKEFRDSIGALQTSFARVEGSHTEMIRLMKKNGNCKQKDKANGNAKVRSCDSFDLIKWLKYALVGGVFLGTLFGALWAALNSTSLL